MKFNYQDENANSTNVVDFGNGPGNTRVVGIKLDLNNLDALADALEEVRVSLQDAVKETGTPLTDIEGQAILAVGGDEINDIRADISGFIRGESNVNPLRNKEVQERILASIQADEERRKRQKEERKKKVEELLANPANVLAAVEQMLAFCQPKTILGPAPAVSKEIAEQTLRERSEYLERLRDEFNNSSIGGVLGNDAASRTSMDSYIGSVLNAYANDPETRALAQLVYACLNAAETADRQQLAQFPERSKEIERSGKKVRTMIGMTGATILHALHLAAKANGGVVPVADLGPVTYDDNGDFATDEVLADKAA